MHVQLLGWNAVMQLAISTCQRSCYQRCSLLRDFQLGWLWSKIKSIWRHQPRFTFIADWRLTGTSFIAAWTCSDHVTECCVSAMQSIRYEAWISHILLSNFFQGSKNDNQRSHCILWRGASSKTRPPPAIRHPCNMKMYILYIDIVSCTHQVTGPIETQQLLDITGLCFPRPPQELARWEMNIQPHLTASAQLNNINNGSMDANLTSPYCLIGGCLWLNFDEKGWNWRKCLTDKNLPEPARIS